MSNGALTRAVSGSVAVVSALKVLEVATQPSATRAGATREAILARAEIDPALLANVRGTIPLVSQHALWEAAVEECGDRSLPLRVAEACEPATFHVLGYACMTAPNLRAALERMVRFLGLFLEGDTLALEPGTTEVRLVLSQHAPPRLGRQLSAESTLAKILVAIRAITGLPNFKASIVTFAHPAPRDIAPFERLFGCEVRFDDKRTQMGIHASALDRPLAKADPALSAFFEQHAEAMLRERGASETAASRVRRAITEAIHAGEVSETVVGTRRGWSERTLRRRLAEEQTSFREALDEVRQDLAQRWLRDREMAIAEVAFLLGFAEPSSFHRAFKRWTGRTPDEFRRAG